MTKPATMRTGEAMAELATYVPGRHAMHNGTPVIRKHPTRRFVWHPAEVRARARVEPVVPVLRRVG